MASLPIKASLALLLGSAVLTTGQPANAQGVIDSVLGLVGLRPEAEEAIDYRERAPLVVPPKMELRPPEQSPTASNPAWPNDPDVAQRKRNQAERNKPRPAGKEAELAGGGPMKPGEMPGSRTYGANRQQEPAPYVRDGSLEESGWVRPDKLRTMGGPPKDQQQALVAGQEPPRRYLTDPPGGYRIPAAGGPLTAGKTLVAPMPSDREERDPLAIYRPKPKVE